MGPNSIVSTAVNIVARPARVWDVLVDVERWPEWTPTVTRVERLDSGPLAIGSRARIHQPRLRAAVWEVIDLNEAKGVFVWATRRAGISTTGSHLVSGTPLGCRATLSIVFSGLLAPITRLMMRKLTREYVHNEAESLKLRSELWRRPGTREQGTR